MLHSHLQRGLQFRKTGTRVSVVFKFNSEVWETQRSLTRPNTRQMCGQTHARARESRMYMAAGKNEWKPVCPKHCCLKGENKKEGKELGKKSFFRKTNTFIWTFIFYHSRWPFYAEPDSHLTPQGKALWAQVRGINSKLIYEFHFVHIQYFSPVCLESATTAMMALIDSVTWFSRYEDMAH